MCTYNFNQGAFGYTVLAKEGEGRGVSGLGWGGVGWVGWGVGVSEDDFLFLEFNSIGIEKLYFFLYNSIF